MKRGRPRDDYPQGEFRSVVLEQITRRSMSLRVLEILTGINRGTLSAVLNGKRPCERQDRTAILRALGIAPDGQDQFPPIDTNVISGRDRVLLDGLPASHPNLQHGQILMSRGQFAEAHEQFRQTFAGFAAEGSAILQAEAAALLGWSYGELERFGDARRWLGESVRLIERDLRLTSDEILDSLGTSGPISETSMRYAQTLARALRVYAKILTVKIVHEMDYVWLDEARRTFIRTVRLDERLQLPELPHTLRWNAVFVSAQDSSTLDRVDALLSSSRELLPSGSPGEASLTREQGIARWQKNRVERAWHLLWDAKERLTNIADARALGPTFCVLSKLTVQSNANPVQARRYALMAAALHPYGYVLDHCAEQMRGIPAVDRQRDIDILLGGDSPFDTVHHVLSRVVRGSEDGPMSFLQRSVSRVRQAIQYSYEAPRLLGRL